MSHDFSVLWNGAMPMKVSLAQAKDESVAFPEWRWISIDGISCGAEEIS